MKIEAISAHNTYNCSAKGGKYKNINSLHKKFNGNNDIIKTNSLSNGNIIGNKDVLLLALQNCPDLLLKSCEGVPTEFMLHSEKFLGAMILKDIIK